MLFEAQRGEGRGKDSKMTTVGREDKEGNRCKRDPRYDNVNLSRNHDDSTSREVRPRLKGTGEKGKFLNIIELGRRPTLTSPLLDERRLSSKERLFVFFLLKERFFFKFKILVATFFYYLLKTKRF